MKLAIPALVMATFLTALYAGMGFFMLIGVNPAVSKLSDAAFAEFWQHGDHFMAARMKIYGPLQLLCSLLAVILLLKNFGNLSFWCAAIALGILIVDMLFIFTQNHPLNQLIQSWDLNQLPADVSVVKNKVVAAFYIRSWFMIGAFVFTFSGLLLKLTGR